MIFRAIFPAVMAILTASQAAPAQAPLAVSGMEDIETQWQQKVWESAHLRTSGALGDAMRSLEAALQMARSLGEESYYVGTTLSRIGALYLDQGKDQLAVLALARALSNMEKSLGPEHSEVADCLSELGLCYRKTGHYGEAEAAIARALLIYQRSGRGVEIAGA